MEYYHDERTILDILYISLWHIVKILMFTQFTNKEMQSQK